MKRSNALLELEKVIDTPLEDPKTRTLNKFLLKPNMKLNKSDKSSLLTKLPTFLEEFKNNNSSLLANPEQVEKANIENQKTNNKELKQIKMVR